MKILSVLMLLFLVFLSFSKVFGQKMLFYNSNGDSVVTQKGDQLIIWKSTLLNPLNFR